MFLALVSKAVLTALVILAVAKAVERLGSRFGGILTGAPMVLGPAYYFIITENSSIFIAQAILSSMNAMTATLVFTSIYLLIAHRISLIFSLLLSSAGWVGAMSLMIGCVESSALSSVVFAATFVLAKVLTGHINSDITLKRTKNGNLDTLWRATAAGILVGIGTGLVNFTGPSLSGAIVGFPIGMTTIVLTLHRRHGHEASRATIAAAQTGMISIFAFLLVLAYFPEDFSKEISFIFAIATALLSTSLFLILDHTSTPSVAGRNQS